MNRKLRVLMTADSVGGVWTYALELARALAAQSVDVWLATMGGPLTPEQWLQARDIQLFQSCFRLEWMTDPWEDVCRAGEWLLELEQRLRPDVVHLNSYAHAALGWSAPVLAVGHSCVLSWWRAVRGAQAPPEWAPYRDAVAAGLSAASLVVCPTRAMLSTLEENYPGTIHDGRVIPNGRSADVFRPAFKNRFVLSAGRLWDEAKNARALEAAVAHLSWPVLLAGDESHPDGGQAGFRGLHSLGQLGTEELARYYARAPIYALPARYEPFGLSVLEAALSSCALVLGDIPSLRENWDGAAVFVPPDDPQALGCGIEGLIADPPRRAELGAQARIRAMEFTPQRMAEAYLACYRELSQVEETRCA